jgi:serine phosphatase RsbU (regulator of sigma subunit)
MMKISFFVFGALIAQLILLSPVMVCQELIITNDSLNNSIKVGSGYELSDKVWLISYIDDLEFSKKNYDDSKWSKLNLGADTAKETLIKKGIGWIRLHLKIDSSLINKNLTLLLNNYFASEIYVNGTLIEKFGKVSSDPSKEKEYNPRLCPIVITFDSTDNQVLAIRYSGFKLKNSKSVFKELLKTTQFQIYLSKVNSTIRKSEQNVFSNTLVNISLFGMIAALAFSHILIFFYNKKMKSHLYYSLHSLALGGVCLASGLLYSITTVGSYLIYAVFVMTCLIVLFCFYLAFLYSIYYPKMPRRIYYIISFFTIYLVANFLVKMPSTYELILQIIFLLMLIEGFRVIILAVRKKIEGAKIIAIGAGGFILFLLSLTAIQVFGLNKTINELIIMSILYAGFGSIPLSMAIYLARDFSRTNKKLELKVIEVEELSVKAIEHERKEAELKIQAEKEKSKSIEAELRAKAAELQAKAMEAETKYLQSENDRKTQELEEARSVQLSLLPKELPTNNRFEISVFMKTATEVGGDYYDFYLDSNGELTSVIGDATGHGVKAGVMVTAAKSLFIAYANKSSLIEILNDMNQAIKKMNLGMLYMALTIIKIKNDILKVASAGMPFTLIYRSKTKDVEEVKIKRMPLGAFEPFNYEEKEYKLESGDIILLMSDGFPELFNKNKEMYGYSSAVAAFQNIGCNSPKKIIEELSILIDQWSDGNPPNDDITFVVIKIK